MSPLVGTVLCLFFFPPLFLFICHFASYFLCPQTFLDVPPFFFFPPLLALSYPSKAKFFGRDPDSFPPFAVIYGFLVAQLPSCFLDFRTLGPPPDSLKSRMFFALPLALLMLCYVFSRLSPLRFLVSSLLGGVLPFTVLFFPRPTPYTARCPTNLVFCFVFWFRPLPAQRFFARFSHWIFFILCGCPTVRRPKTSCFCFLPFLGRLLLHYPGFLFAKCAGRFFFSNWSQPNRVTAASFFFCEPHLRATMFPLCLFWRLWFLDFFTSVLPLLELCIPFFASFPIFLIYPLSLSLALPTGYLVSF